MPLPISDPALLRWALSSAVLVAALSTAASAQSHDEQRYEPAPFECLENGLAKGQAFGCQLLARPQLAPSGDRPVFWHLTTFSTRRAAESAKRSTDAVVEADGRFWVTSLGPRGDTLAHGSRVASIGPLPLPMATSYQMDLYHVIMPPHSRTRVHVHPGPEAWYVLKGEQCLETPLGAARAKAGQGSIAPPGGTPMQLTNTGRGTRRALFIVVHDPSVPMSMLSDWHPKGLCDHEGRSGRGVSLSLPAVFFSSASSK
jgi:quercetin dioxygenase-like cupin family protein